MSNISQATEPAGRPRAVLIVAHPGHELLLHHWLECVQPIVCTLTDGSGSQAHDRAHRSKKIIQKAGARVGPVFSETTDRGWYQAILSGDRGLFDSAADRIAELCRTEDVTQIVADPFEFFNPMHDLCSCLAQNVSMRLRASNTIELLTYPIERPDLFRSDPAHVYHLNHEALQRKLASAAEYLELGSEVERRRSEAADNLACERLFLVDTGRLSERRPPGRPFYERVGGDRVGRGLYTELITYEAHVQPLATMLTGGAG
jgi:hypothetical protein